MRVFLSVLCLLMASCASFSGSSQVRFADDLGGSIQAETPTMVRNDDNLLQVSVPLRNVSGDDLQLLVQIEFLDAAGEFVALGFESAEACFQFIEVDTLLMAMQPLDQLLNAFHRFQYPSSGRTTLRSGSPLT